MDSHAPLDPFVVTVVGHSPPVLPPLIPITTATPADLNPPGP